MGKSPTLTGDVLHIRYVAVDTARKWERNPKQHDLDGIVLSILKHGFRDAPIYDETLDAISAGNGRTTAVAFIRDEPNKVRGICAEAGFQWDGQPPQGIAVDSDGKWYLPMQFGINAASVAAAESFAVDHNNLTMMGGEFSFFDIAKMWDEDAYVDLLLDLRSEGDLPIGVTSDDIDDLARALNLSDEPPSLDALEREFGDHDPEDMWPEIRIKVEPMVEEKFWSMLEAVPGANDSDKLDRLLSAVDMTALD